MTSLRIANLTGSPLSFTCSSSLAPEWTNLDHDSKATVLASGPGKQAKRPSICLLASPLGYLNDEKAIQPNSGGLISWTFVVRRPQTLGDKRSWRLVHPVCQHGIPSATHHEGSRKCCQEHPWNVYVLHAKGESHVLFLRARDMSSFLSETEDERLLSDVVLPGTHDSLAFYGWPVSQCQSPNQPLYIQLMSGIRAIDVRLAVVDGVLMAYHGVAPQRTSFSSILHTLNHFLQDRPRECLVVSLKQEDYASTSPRVFSRLVREEIERSEGGMGLWWLENRIPRLGEVRGRCIMLSRFGGDGKEWEGRLEGMGIHPTEWPDSEQEGFEWNLKGTIVRTHDWYNIPSLLSLPEKTALCIQNLVPPLSDPPTLGITFLSASGGPLALPSFCALGFGWPSWGLGVEGINSRVGRWLLGRLTSSTREKANWSIASDHSDALLLDGEQIARMDAPIPVDKKAETLASNLEPCELPVRGWVFMDYFGEPDEGLVPLLVENNFISRN